MVEKGFPVPICFRNALNKLENSFVESVLFVISKVQIVPFILHSF